MDRKSCTDNSLPLYQKISRKSNVKNFFNIIIFFLLLSLLVYRLLFLNNHDFSWLLAFLCELWFTFYWVLVISIKWTPVEYKTYPDRLLQWVGDDELKLPSVDMFVTTADPELEPPILTINTVLSLLAVDYPSHKLACYVSDDGCSPIILYSLMEAYEFAKLWVPFCKKYNVEVRAPFRYFSFTNEISQPFASEYHQSKDFQQEWKIMKDKYEQLNRIIEAVIEKSVCDDQLSCDFEAFLNVERRNHPTIIKVISENNKQDLADGLPQLVYISREKRPKHPHHFKAGAMNVLARVSGMMTNAPFMLNVDCDMFVNNPKVVLHAMCLLIGPKGENDFAFAQFPQIFYDGLKDDPFGNQLVVLFEYMGRGVAGIQGALYGGTGCFHRRKVMYGLSPDDIEIDRRDSLSNDEANGKLTKDQELIQRFGNSKEFTRTTSNALTGNKEEIRESFEKSIEAAYEVAACGYENGTNWGTEVGWIYGSTTEDVHTSLIIHKKGWRSALCWPEPPAFLGCAPSSGPASMTQQKRWATGLLEIMLSKNCPIFFTLFDKLQFRQCLAYVYIFTWGLRSIAEQTYAHLLAYSLITNSQFFPKSQEPTFYVLIAFFGLFNLYTLCEYFATGQSIRAWWNNHKMGRVTTMGAWLLGVLGVVLKLLGISDTVFEVTKKENNSTLSGTDNMDNADVSKFTFDKSPVFIPVTAVLLVQLTALAMVGLGLQPPPNGGQGSGVLEVFCSMWLVLCLRPILEGLFRKGKYGIPLPTVCKSLALALLFVLLCNGNIAG